MKRVAVPLALAAAATVAMACPGGKEDMNAQAPGADKLALMAPPTAATPARTDAAKPAQTPSSNKAAPVAPAAKKPTGV